jgi:hypothetical protein
VCGLPVIHAPKTSFQKEWGNLHGPGFPILAEVRILGLNGTQLSNNECSNPKKKNFILVFITQNEAWRHRFYCILHKSKTI